MDGQSNVLIRKLRKKLRQIENLSRSDRTLSKEEQEKVGINLQSSYHSAFAGVNKSASRMPLLDFLELLSIGLLATIYFLLK